MRSDSGMLLTGEPIEGLAVRSGELSQWSSQRNLLTTFNQDTSSYGVGQQDRKPNDSSHRGPYRWRSRLMEERLPPPWRGRRHVRLWDVETGVQNDCLQRPCAMGLFCDFSPTGSESLLARDGQPSKCGLWTARTQSMIWLDLFSERRTAGTPRVAMSPDGSLLAAMKNRKPWDHRRPSGQSGDDAFGPTVHSLCFPLKVPLAVAQSRGLQLWDVETEVSARAVPRIRRSGRLASRRTAVGWPSYGTRQVNLARPIRCQTDGASWKYAYPLGKVSVFSGRKTLDGDNWGTAYITCGMLSAGIASFLRENHWRVEQIADGSRLLADGRFLAVSVGTRCCSRWRGDATVRCDNRHVELAVCRR